MKLRFKFLGLLIHLTTKHDFLNKTRNKNNKTQISELTILNSSSRIDLTESESESESGSD